MAPPKIAMATADPMSVRLHAPGGMRSGGGAVTMIIRMVFLTNVILIAMATESLTIWISVTALHKIATETAFLTNVILTVMATAFQTNVKSLVVLWTATTT